MKKLIKTIALVLFILLVLVLSLFKWLDFYTNKGQVIEVPELRGKMVGEIQNLDLIDFKIKIMDSLYDRNKSRGIILNQDPKPKSKVKPGRTIYLTLNKVVPSLITVPDLIDETPVIGIEKLKNAGFEIGRIDTTDYEIPIIVEVDYNGAKISKGEKLQEGSRIDLKVGRGELDE